MIINCTHPSIIRNPEFNNLTLQGYKTILYKENVIHTIGYKNIQRAFKGEYQIIPILRINKGFEKKDLTDDTIPTHINKISTVKFKDKKPIIIKYNRDQYKRIYTIDYDDVPNYQILNEQTGDLQPVFMQVPCNHCPLCAKRKREKLSSRLILHSKQYDTSPMFLTLTYAKLPENQSQKAQVEEIQKFNKRLRKHLERYNVKYKYVFVSEYGYQNGRLHYHALIYGIPQELQKFIKVNKRKYKVTHLPKFSIIVEACWKKGFIKCEEARDKTGQYVAKYIGKSQDKETIHLKSIRMGVDEVEQKAEELRESPQTKEIHINIDGKIEIIPYYDWVRNIIYPSLCKQLSIDFRNALKTLHVHFTKNQYTIQDYYLNFVDKYQNFIKLLGYNDIDIDNIKDPNLKEHEIQRYLEILEIHDYDIELVTYINTQRNKHIQLNNISLNIDTNLKTYLEEIRFNQVRQNESDGQ